MFGLKDCARLGSLYARRLAGVAALFVVSSGAAAVVVIPNLFPFLDPTGLVSTFNTAGPIVEKGPFFESLGTNGRKCSTCHLAQDAMGLSTRIGFVGLGIMGAPMAANLVKAGFEVTGYNRSPERVEQLVHDLRQPGDLLERAAHDLERGRR